MSPPNGTEASHGAHEGRSSLRRAPEGVQGHGAQHSAGRTNTTAQASASSPVRRWTAAWWWRRRTDPMNARRILPLAWRAFAAFVALLAVVYVCDDLSLRFGIPSGRRTYGTIQVASITRSRKRTTACSSCPRTRPPSPAFIRFSRTSVTAHAGTRAATLSEKSRCRGPQPA